jgi:hypothetical protein
LGAPAERRYGENVVQLPEDEINPGARGRVTHWKAESDGSGAVSLDLSKVYSAPVRNAKGSALPLYERYGRIPHPQAFGDSGIHGLRSMAVDFSGKSGAPCMIVLVDRIEGGKGKSWTWQLESKSEKVGKSTKHPKKEGWVVFRGREFDNPRNGELLFSESKVIEADERVKLEADGFTLTQGDANLRATFVIPSKPRLEFAEKAQYRDLPKFGVQRNSSKAVFATGGDEFFAILTFQRGRGPEVRTLQGKGLGATVRVGEQTVRFDGQKIIFGE